MRLRYALLLTVLTVAPIAAQTTAPQTSNTVRQSTDRDDQTDSPNSRLADVLIDTPDTDTQLEQLAHALKRLPIAAGLASLLALRPRRRGTPPRQTGVIHTQIILAVVGAVVMLVVGSSLARAFGIVGAAGLVRYRARINDPKDAGVMLSTLAIGLASGVGLWMLGIFSTLFVLGLLWVLESFEPKALQHFALKVQAKDPLAFKPKIEHLLARTRIDYELRTESTKELVYDVQMAIDRKTDHLSDLILKLDTSNATGVEWEEKKEKK
jgi:uncharacterized membrane protein YhiD involved in acid resistance